MVAQAVVGRLAEGVDLPEDDAEGEDVRFGRINPSLDAFRGHPSDRNGPQLTHL